MMSKDYNDEALVELIVKQDHKAYQVIVERYGLRCRNFAFNIVQDNHSAEDIVQDAFLKLWMNAKVFDPTKAKFSTWFHQIIVNRCIDHQRRKAPDELPDHYDIEDHSPQADALLEQQRDIESVIAAVKSLRKRQATAIALFYFNELTLKEAASVMQVTPKAFESLLLRSRQALAASILTNLPA